MREREGLVSRLPHLGTEYGLVRLQFRERTSETYNTQGDIGAHLKEDILKIPSRS